ncbi:MAG: glycosyltransferase [Cloacibacterium caeni]
MTFQIDFGKFSHIFFIKKINRIITINTESEKYFKNFNPNTQTIYNIIGEPFENCSVDFEAKENIITYVGRLSKEKNIDHIIDIYNSSKLVNNFKLHIIGEGELREILQKKAHNPNIIFRGIMSSDEICQHLTKSKIIILTSQTEGLSTVLIEAMFCGNILLSYNCNYGPKEIVNNKNGFLIDVGDKSEAIKILNNLTENKYLQKNLMKSSYLESKNWKKEVIINKWLNILS